MPMIIRLLLLVAFLFHRPLSWAQDECAEEPPCEPVELTLDVAVSRALNYNRQIINTIDSKVKAEYSVALAQGDFDIKIHPNGRAGYVGGGREGDGATVGIGMSFSKKFEVGTRVSLEPTLLKGPEHYYNDLNVTVSQPLLRGFGREYQLSGLKGAEFSLRTACRNLYTAQLQLAVKTINALYEVVKAKKNVELNSESYERVKKSYQAAKLKERVGLSDGLDVYRAEIELQQAEDHLASSQERLQDVEDNLKDILALPLESCVEVKVPIVYTANYTCLDEAIETAMANRIEIDQAEDQWREAIRLSQIAKGNLWPELNVVVNYSNRGKDPYFGRSWTCHREDMWGVGLTTSSDFNLVGERIAYEQSLMAVQSAERGMEQAKFNLVMEVKKAIRNLARARKKIELQQKQIHTSQGQLHLSKLKFDRGMANNFDVIQAEKTLRTAQVAYWGALIEHIVGEYQLLLAMGLLTDKPCIK